MQNGQVLAGCEERILYLQFIGDVRLPWCVSLENYCENTITDEQINTIKIDLSKAENLDSTTLGILAKIGLLATRQLQCQVEIYSTVPSIDRLMQSMGFTSVFQIFDHLPATMPELSELPFLDAPEREVQDSVIGAHRTLMDIDQDNQNKFKSLVDTLEKNRQARD